MNPKLSMADHVAKIEELAKQLSDLGQKQDETVIITKVLTSLPAKYRHVISAWDLLPTNEQTMVNLLPRLLKEEELNKGTTDLKLSDDEDSAALYSKSNKKTQGNHKKSTSSQADKQKFKGTCHYCKNPGHMKRDCYKFKANQKGGNANSVTVDNSASVLTVTSEWPTINNKDVWLPDSGASDHMTSREEWFTKLESVGDRERPVTLGNNKVIFAIGKGEIQFEARVADKITKYTMADVLYVPDISRNLFSLGAAAAKGAEYSGKQDVLKIYSKGKLAIFGKKFKHGLYSLDIRAVKSAESNIAQSKAVPLQVWHERLGHANYKSILELAKGEAVVGLKCSDLKTSGQHDNKFCEACIFGKQHKIPYKESENRAGAPAELIHFNVVGPMSTASLGGSTVMAVFVDDHSGFTFAYPMKDRSFIVDAIQDVLATASAAGHKVRRFRSDNAKEFKSTSLKKILQHLIVHEFSTPRNPQQNGRAKRVNRTIGEMARTMLVSANMPLYMWAEASRTAALIRNRIPLARLRGRTPYEVWTGRKSDMSMLRIFGSKAYNLIDTDRSKFSKKSLATILVDYEPGQKAYRL
ncbi:unnamed protein product [Lasius platythorax]|uniref:Integrase catalytic domain-containing protein n=2 Tax=Lasius platythorax TaxID=488582 RepID=A0AAV2MY43_9HYME